MANNTRRVTYKTRMLPQLEETKSNLLHRQPLKKRIFFENLMIRVSGKSNPLKTALSSQNVSFLINIKTQKHKRKHATKFFLQQAPLKRFWQSLASTVVMSYSFSIPFRKFCGMVWKLHLQLLVCKRGGLPEEKRRLCVLIICAFLVMYMSSCYSGHSCGWFSHRQMGN